jgi:NADH-quinone oxidoreductase subunit H
MNFLIDFARCSFVLFGVLNLAGLLTWVERKQSALIQDRIGANRATLFGIRALGLMHPLADVLKMLTKEDFIPNTRYRTLHTLAPAIAVFFAIISFAAIPFGNVLHIGGREIVLQALPLNIGFVFIFAMMSMAVYGAVLGGISSNNNYAFLGGMRAASQMIGYEITMGATLIGIVMCFGTLDLQEISRAQGTLLFGWLPNWGVFLQPIGFILFLTAAVAETKRIPFDTPEGESEIVGYFVEYSGMKFGMFMLADFIESVVVSGMLTVLFFGGWQVPYLGVEGFLFPWGAAWDLPHLVVVLFQMASFSLKVIFFCWLQMMIRWTLPRFRYDQVMRLGWQYMLPLAIANIVVTGAVLLWL